MQDKLLYLLKETKFLNGFLFNYAQEDIAYGSCQKLKKMENVIVELLNDLNTQKELEDWLTKNDN